MLHKESVEPELFELLKKLMRVPEFGELRLVGGTSLSLQIGHRISVDIDLFGKINLDETEVKNILSQYGAIHLINKSKNIFIYSVNQIKVDLVNYQVNWLEDPLMIEGLRLAGKKDIAAMKLNAIAGRGSKKDFIDLFFLMREFSLKEMIGFYNQKYPDGSEFLVLKSMTYFNDADKESDLKILIDVEWEKIKSHILLMSKKYLNP